MTLDQIGLKLVSDFKNQKYEHTNPSFIRPRFYHFSRIEYRQVNAIQAEFNLPTNPDDLQNQIDLMQIEKPHLVNENFSKKNMVLCGGYSFILDISSKTSHERKQAFLTLCKNAMLETNQELKQRIEFLYELFFTHLDIEYQSLMKQMDQIIKEQDDEYNNS